MEDENRIDHVPSQLAHLDHSRGDICSNIMEINVTRSRAIMDDITRHLSRLLRALASEFLVGSEEEAMEDLRQRLEVIAVEQIALATHSKQEGIRELRVKSTNNIAIPLKEYILPMTRTLPRHRDASFQ